MVRNIDCRMGHKIKTKPHPAHGTQCAIQYSINRNPAQSLQENEINNCDWVLPIQLIQKISERHRKFLN